MARAEGELCDANKALDKVVKEADTVNQQRNTMHTEKRTRDKKLRDAQVSVGVWGGGNGYEWHHVLLMCTMTLDLAEECCKSSKAIDHRQYQGEVSSGTTEK